MASKFMKSVKGAFKSHKTSRQKVSRTERHSVTSDISDGYLSPVTVANIGTVYLDTNMPKENAKLPLEEYMTLEQRSEPEYLPYDSIWPTTESDSTSDHRNETCNLTRRGLTEVPKEVLENGDIKFLDLDQNQFGVLPAAIYGMTGLTKIRASGQVEDRPSRSPYPALYEIPEGIERLQELSHLFLFNNALMKLPVSFGQLLKLRHLDLRLNQFTDFPQCLCHMPELIVLHLSGNKIKIIPRDINNMKSLEVLSLDNNQVEVIPDELCQMTKLDYFAIRNNQIKELPRGLIYLTNLIPSGEETDKTRRLFVEGNPLVYPPEDYRKTTSAIFEYLQNYQSHSNAGERKRNTAYLIPTLEAIENDTSLKDYLEDHGLKMRTPTPAGDTSFFNALADQLQRPGMDLQDFTHTELKQNLVEYLQNIQQGQQKRNTMKKRESSDVLAWIEMNGYTTVDDYVDKISQDEPLADDVAIKAAALMLQRDICVIAKTSNPLLSSEGSSGFSIWSSVFQGGTEGKALHIACYQSHFLSLGLLNEDIHYDDTEIPPAPKIPTVNLSNKGLQKLPSSVTSDTEVLRLSKNHLTNAEWWKDLQSLPNLHSLDISEQQVHSQSRDYKTLSVIPSDIHYYAQNLTELVMSGNKIMKLPLELSFLKSLQLLDLVNNYIMEIPPEFCDLPELEYLGLSGNKLTSLPERIGSLTRLVVFRLSDNSLERLPESMCNLQKLQVLSLSNNRLVMLPQQLFKLGNLLSSKVYRNKILSRNEFHAQLRVNGNDTIKYPSSEICKGGTKAIFQFLEHMEHHPEQRDKILCTIETSSGSPFSFGQTGSRTFKQLTDVFLNKLSNKLGRSWRSLGIVLELEREELDILEDNNPGDKLQAINDMLYRWRNRNCGRLSEDKLIERLLAALGEIGRNDLKEKLLPTYKRISQMS